MTADESAAVRRWLGLWAWAASALWVGAVTCMAGAAESELLTGIDYVEPADVDAEIQWRQTWQNTYQATVASWQAEFDEVADAHVRQQREQARELRLLAALIRRFPDAPQRDEAVMHQAVLFERLSPRLDRGLRLLARRLDDLPDDPARAVTLLRAMHERAAGLREAGEWPALIGRRLLMLHQTGHAVDEPLMREALWRWLAQLQSQRRYFAAREVLRAMEQAAPADDPALRGKRLLAWVDLYLAAGLIQPAADRIAPLKAAVAQIADEEAAERLVERVRRIEDQVERFRNGQPFEVPPSLTEAYEIMPTLERLRGAADIDVSRIDQAYARQQIVRQLVKQDARRYTSGWSALAAELDRKPDSEVAALSSHQQREAEGDGQAMIGLDVTALMARYRRYPWSEAGQRALLAAAEHWLRVGELELARRSISDVLKRPASEPLAAGARLGADLLDSQDRASTAESSQPSPSPPLAETLRLPSADLWMAGPLSAVSPKDAVDLPRGLDLVEGPGFVMLAHPTLLARYELGHAEPTWVRRQPAPTEERGEIQVATLPGPFEPAVDGSRILTRWGLRADRRGAADVAAFDADSGAMLWTTTGHADWQDLQPLSDPVAVAQRAYVLARERLDQGLTPRVRAIVVAVDAASGDIVWRSPVAAFAAMMQVGSLSIDTIHYGNRVAVAQGAVYVSTGGGVYARLDARDGLIEWLGWYPPALRGERWQDWARRLGGQPQVFDEVVVFTPRDRSGAFAVDRATGAPRWDDPLLPADAVVTSVADAVVFHGGREIIAVEAGSGTIRWRRTLGEPIAAPPVAHDGRCHIATDRDWLELDLTTGEVTAQHEDVWPEPVMLLADTAQGVVALTAAPVAASAPRRTPLRPEESPETTYLPVQVHPASHASIWLVPASSEPPADFMLYGGGWLERVDGGPQPIVRWRRPVPMGLLSTHWYGQIVVLVFSDRALAVDLSDGSLAWQTRLPFAPDVANTVGEYLLLGHHTDQVGRTVDRMTGVALATGQLAWDRPLNLRWTPPVMWDGRRAYALTHNARHPDAELREFDLVTGAVRSASAYRHDPSQMPPPSHVLHEVDAMIVLAEDKQVYEVRPGEPPSVRPYSTLPEAFSLGQSHHAIELYLHDQRWIEVRRYHGPPHQHVNYHQWLFDRDDRDTLIHRTNDGRIFGDDVYELDAATARLTVFDLLEQRELVTVELPRRDRLRSVHLIEAWREDGLVYTLTTSARDREDAAIHLDVFDASTAKHLAARTLARVRSLRHSPGPGQTRLLRATDHFVLADARGVYVFQTVDPSSLSNESPQARTPSHESITSATGDSP